MEVSLFLAKVLGFYFLIAGVALLTQYKEWQAMITDFVKNKHAKFVSGAIILFLGLVMAVAHNIWSSDWRAVITLIAWLAVMKGIMYLLVPQESLGNVMKLFKAREWYATWGVVAILLGLYLIYQGWGRVVV
jgi:hypothetical protein